jgi:hypothetical protein
VYDAEAPAFTRMGVKVTGAETVNVTAGLVPPEVVTVTLAAPSVALAAMAKVAVICVALTTVTRSRSPRLHRHRRPGDEIGSASVTGTLLPVTPLLGADRRLGVAGGIDREGHGTAGPPLSSPSR